jgi:anaerobic selenocysteine-containing dehydrogenase
MMDELIASYQRDEPTTAADVEGDYPFLLIGRRDKGFVNGTGQDISKLTAERSYNPAYLHPADLEDLGLKAGQMVEIRSAHGCVEGIVAADATLRRRVVSMTHAFGQNPGDDKNPARFGTNTNQLLTTTAEYDRITGMPRMGSVPVRITTLDGAVST